MIGEFLNKVINARGIAKQHVLKKYSDVEAIRDVLYYTYNKDLVYGLRADPVSPISIFGRVEPLHEDEINFLVKLANKKLSGNEAKYRLNCLTIAHGNLIKLILNRNLQIGIAATTINKIMPGLIPQFKIQLAKEVPLDKIKYPCWAQLKYDGVRIVAKIENNRVVFKTRNNKSVNLPKLAKLINDAPIDKMVLDGELVYKDGKMAARTSISGAVNSAMHGGTINEADIVFQVFDFLSLEDFNANKNRVTYEDRFFCAKTICNAIGNERIKIAENIVVKSAEDVNKLAETMYEQGYEGLILKHPSHKYTFKRSKDWVKIKQIKTADLRVYSALEGQGKYTGMVGALICSGIVEGKPIRVHVGSGLSDIQRCVPMDYYNDEIVEVKYNSIIQDSATGQWSLFLPRFVCIRHDKN